MMIAIKLTVIFVYLVSCKILEKAIFGDESIAEASMEYVEKYTDIPKKYLKTEYHFYSNIIGAIFFIILPFFTFFVIIFELINKVKKK